jgi:hypothetical protein
VVVFKPIKKELLLFVGCLLLLLLLLVVVVVEREIRIQRAVKKYL